MSQELLLPQTVHLDLEDVNLIFAKKHLRELETLGFRLKLIDDENFEILAIPQILEGEDWDKIFAEFAEYFRCC